MFGMRIAILRSAHGMSQAELARQLNVSPSAVGMYEQGRREPSLGLVVRLARVLGVTTDYLLTGESPTPPPPAQQKTQLRIEMLLHLLKEASMDRPPA